MMFKRVLAIGLALVMALGLVACGGGGSEKDPIDDIVVEKGFDPFQFISFMYSGEVGEYALSQNATTIIIGPDGQAYQIGGIEVSREEGKPYYNGDTVHVKLPENAITSLNEKFGEDFLKRTEADIKLEHMPELPDTAEKAKQFLEILDEPCLDNASYAVRKQMNSTTKTETEVELVGSMLYYMDAGKTVSNSKYCHYNQLVLIYKVTNEKMPGGWYTYMAYNGDVILNWVLNKGTIQFERATSDAYGNRLMDDYRYYHSEDERIYDSKGFPMSFDVEGVTYPGHTALADAIQSMKVNAIGEAVYDHLVVSDSLADYIDAY